jgi:hypothetical protein
LYRFTGRIAITVPIARRIGAETIMPQSKPPVFGTAVTAWADAFGVIVAMPFVAGVAFVILFLLSFTLWIIPNPDVFVTSRWLPVYTVVSSIVRGVLLAPLAIVVHRYVLLGELTDRYPLDPFNARYVRFAGFAVLVNVLWSLPSVIEGYTPDMQQIPGIGASLGIVSTALSVTIIVVVVRRVILFPAVAIDAPGATWSNARRDTKGSSWRVALILFLVALPALIAAGALYYFYYFMLGAGLGGGSQLTFTLLRSLFAVATLCAFAAAASHIFRARADNLARPVPGTI